jgi:ABC-type multidrug transport system fused ATPase/permease subunit
MLFIKKLLFLLPAKEYRNFYFLIFVMLITACLDVIGVASVLPFMSVLTNPEIIETNLILKSSFEISNIFGVEDKLDFLIFLGVIVFILLIFSLIFRALSVYMVSRFSFMTEHIISKRLIEYYLSQPYSWFLNRHSSDMGNSILSEVSHVISSGLKPLMDLISKGLITIALVTLLIIVEPKVAIMIGLSLGGTYFLIYKIASYYLNLIGKKRLENNQLRFRAVNEGFSAIKEIKVEGLEKFYIELFSKPSQAYSTNQIFGSLFSALPRFFFEGIAFGGMMILIIYMMLKSGKFFDVIPIISLYVFTGYRLIPALQQIYAALSQLAFVGPAVDKLYNEFKNLKINNLINYKADTFEFKESIILENIYYKYPNASRWALEDISLKIPAKSSVGFVGATGSGKTTVIDIILNLLEVERGSLKIDGKVLNKKNLRAWQQSIGYVPQHIYLSDDTITANIAFGKKSEEINQKRIEKAAKIANLHEFIMSDLPKKYQTLIGERGVRLSGGQRQRLAIARALYFEPKILVLDEATSALDNLTEEKVMSAINNISKDITIIMIAHRLNTVRNCEIIFKLEKGKLLSFETSKVGYRKT